MPDDKASLPVLQKPEWLPSAISDAQQALRVISMDNFPAILQGQFCVTIALRLLRCVYGSDLESVAALRRKVLNDVEFWQKIDAMSHSEAKQFFQENACANSQTSRGERGSAASKDDWEDRE